METMKTIKEFIEEKIEELTKDKQHFYTLAKFDYWFNPSYIQIKIGKHLINIDCCEQGSARIYRVFKLEKFHFYLFDKNRKLLILTDSIK